VRAGDSVFQTERGTPITEARENQDAPWWSTRGCWAQARCSSAASGAKATGGRCDGGRCGGINSGRLLARHNAE
jgi:hypothetical protein